jgi:hypothetical protein
VPIAEAPTVVFSVSLEEYRRSDFIFQRRKSVHSGPP